MEAVASSWAHETHSHNVEDWVNFSLPSQITTTFVTEKQMKFMLSQFKISVIVHSTELSSPLELLREKSPPVSFISQGSHLFLECDHISSFLLCGHKPSSLLPVVTYLSAS